MPVSRDQLVSYCDELLGSARFVDYCPNGLQVEGRDTVGTLVTGVTASLALIEAAIERKADAVLVHHGYFWRGEDPAIRGMKAARIRRLMVHGCSLLAYHLPLDAHDTLGNNACLARHLGLSIRSPLFANQAEGAGLVCEAVPGTTVAALSESIRVVCAREPLVLGADDDARPLTRVALCTGAAQGFIERAVAVNADAYISGEVSEQTLHICREAGIVYFAAGHHATERFGVQALGLHLAERFSLHHEFIDIPNPV